MQNRGTCCLKKCFKDPREIWCAKIKRNSIINKNVLHSEDPLMHYKGAPSNYLFQLFIKLKGRPEENSSYFWNVQPYTIICTLDAFIK